MILKIVKKHAEKIWYLIFGVSTTLVNFLFFYLLTNFMKAHYIIANVIAWGAAVMFAYITNRAWVFKSRAKKVGREFLIFFLSRLFSLGLETFLLIFSVDLMQLSVMFAKVIVAFVVVATNYATSKFFVFKETE